MEITIKGIIGRKINSSYSGNRQIRVVDAADPVVTNGSMDFKDGTDTGVEYTYNACGALTSDLNKGISGIDYNINGNMSKVTFSNGNTTEYVYSQSGAKQRVIHGTVTALPFAEPGISTAEAASVSRDTTEYIGDFVFRNGVLDRLLFRGGYMDIAGGVPRYHYFATDHLGSVRTVYGEDGVAEQLLTYDLFGGIIPELSTGMGMQPYGYNGKELDPMHGLYTYDYGARQYDPATILWDRMDPLCEKYYNVSPYVYCNDNPVIYIDEHGDSLSLSGSKDDINSTLGVYNQGLGGYYQVSTNQKGIVTLNANKNTDSSNMTEKEKAVYNQIKRVIDSQYMTTINITNNSSEVIIGSAATATIDIGDIKAMNGLKNSSTVAALMHETNEQSFLQNPNFRANDKYRMIRAHSAAEGLEHSYTGNIDVTNVLNINTNNSGFLEFHRNNRVIERIKIINGNF